MQNAAHRAGFVDHRSHAMSLRTALRRPLSGRMSLPDWVAAAMRAAEGDAFARYRLVPAALMHQTLFEPYWLAEPYTRVTAKTREAVRRRLLFDAALAVGLQTTFGRTLEGTGSIAVHVWAGHPTEVVALGRTALGDTTTQTLDGAEAVSDSAIGTWVRGVLERMRRDGAIEHPNGSPSTSRTTATGTGSGVVAPATRAPRPFRGGAALPRSRSSAARSTTAAPSPE